jgi:formyl-CoA transferase
MLDSLIAFGTSPFAAFFATGRLPGIVTRPASSQAYALRCADDRLVALHLSGIDKFFVGLCEAIGNPELAEDPRFKTGTLRTRNYAELTVHLQQAFVSHDRDYWLAELTRRDVPHAPIATLAEVVDDPQVAHNGIFQKLSHPAEGDVMNVRRPVLYDGDRDAGDRPPPTLGQHTREVLTELGLAADDIESLVSDGVV